MPAISEENKIIVLNKIHCYAQNGESDICPKGINCPFSPELCDIMEDVLANEIV